MMKRWADWIEKSVQPTPEELQRLVEPLDPEVLEHCVEATQPTEDEVHRLLVNRHRWARRRRRQRVAAIGTLGAGAMVAAAAVLVLSGPTADPYGEIGVELGQVASLSGDMQLELGPSIDVVGTATLRVDQADVQGTVLELLDGTASFSVDPKGEYRSLRVQAHDVEVEVAGTVFDVTVDDGAVWVETTRGKVIVRHGGDERYVRAGESWSNQLVAVQIPEPQPPVEEPPAPVEDVASEVPAPAAPRARVVAPHEAAVAEVVDAPEAPAPEADVLRPAPLAMEDVRERESRGEDPDVVLALLDRYIEQYGDGIYGPVLREKRLLHLVKHHPSRRTIQEIDAYLAGNPRAAERIELLWARADLAREQLSDCGLALSTYAELARRVGDDSERARASAWQGLCALTQGDEAQGHAALEYANLLGIEDPQLARKVQAELDELAAQASERRKR